MTQNQINWLKLQEDMRHNIATERENVRANKASEYIGTGTLQEAGRHNLVTEGIAVQTLEESVRHNQMVEVENRRSHQASEAISREANLFNREVGMENVAETKRHHEIEEDFNYYRTDTEMGIRQQEADTRETEVMGQDNSGNMTEKKRANLVNEALNQSKWAIDVLSSGINGFAKVIPYLIK